MSLGGGEILVILLVALVVFGPQRLPEIARQVGKAMSEVRKMQDSVRREIHGALEHDDAENVSHGVPTYDETQIPDESRPHGGMPDHSEPPALPQPDPQPHNPSAGSFS